MHYEKFILFIVLSIFVIDFINGQITDYEKELRKIKIAYQDGK